MTDEMKVSWTAKHYQVSNRLTFLEKMKSLTGIIPFTRVRLLFINFYNDPTWRDDGLTVKSSKDWEDKYDSIFRDLGNIKEKVYQHGVSIINIDASGY